MRHFHFPIGQLERDSWVRHMSITVQSSESSPEDTVLLIEYFERTATLLMNRLE
jgi:truncated hemoglobin YjbI